MPKTKSYFLCRECGFQSPRWLGKCPECRSWNTIEEREQKGDSGEFSPASFLGEDFRPDTPRPLNEISLKGSRRFDTGISEFNRALGGGLVEGSAVLIAGEPGIGKSTLLLQVAHNMTLNKEVGKVLYVCAEESASQLKLRASRLKGFESSAVLICSETNLTNIIETVKELKPKTVILDSVQVILDPEVNSAAGSVSQVRECSGKLTTLAKKLNIPLILVGHVTKEGAVAGPRVLEHMVDTVLYFEGERLTSFRILRAFKNRFGSTNEIGVFQMTENGLSQVDNPSVFFMEEKDKDAKGYCITCALEGSRPILVEFQALLARSSFGMPRRQTSGFDYNRLNLLLAVLEKHSGLRLSDNDIYFNVAGGIKVNEPAADLAAIVAVASAFFAKALRPKTAVFAEVGLTGEIKGVSRADVRISEAGRMGFERVILPKSNFDAAKEPGVELVPVSDLDSALKEVLI
jgi:DNA repair protein RadA/Sms